MLPSLTITQRNRQVQGRASRSIVDLKEPASTSIGFRMRKTDMPHTNLYANYANSHAIAGEFVTEWLVPALGAVWQMKRRHPSLRSHPWQHRTLSGRLNTGLIVVWGVVESVTRGKKSCPG